VRRFLLPALFLIQPVGSQAHAEGPLETTVNASPAGEADALPEERSSSAVTRKEFERRLPRSAPDALRYEPGVFVQQTGHGQGSAFLRGLTGQQTVLLFDGIRLNNATYRQGPNQYFFTLDARTLQSIEVQRGGASTQWGSDALGGALLARPLEPSRAGSPGLHVEPRVTLRGATADSELGGRAQVDVAARTGGGVGLSFLGGVGYRHLGLLRGPPVLNPSRGAGTGALPWVPRYAEYVPTLPFEEQPTLRTQLGTGFRELTADGRLVAELPGAGKLTAAAYLYRQYDAPRTDQCPAPTAPFDECLTYEEQFRHLAYLAWEGPAGGLADTVRATLSWQQQHERRRLDLTSANQVARGVDDVDTLGLTVRAQKRQVGGTTLRLDYGLEHSADAVRSAAGHVYTDTLQAVQLSRGQYLHGSGYHSGGLFLDGTLPLHESVTARAGGRLAWAAARAPGDATSGSAAVERAWFPVVGHAGVEWRPRQPLGLFVNVDRSFRTPNLDDLTSRQQTGPGFQFENPDLRPELAHSLELGSRLRLPWLELDAWVFAMRLDDAVLKVTRTSAQCPPATPQCLGSWSRFQLQNAPSHSEVRGVEAATRVRLPARFTLRGTVTWTWSEGPRVGDLGEGVTGVVLGERVPLSRTPPLNGTAELGWTHPSGFGAGAALQWAAAQERLALADYSDGRIPRYGTPGFAVAHLRASWRLDSRLAVSAVLENVFDSPWRFHGSSVNGPGRGVMVQLDAGQMLF
jgi:outer membrane receptor protein involved in Fe transport